MIDPKLRVSTPLSAWLHCCSFFLQHLISLFHVAQTSEVPHRGHGPMWDLAEDPNSIKLIGSFLAAGKPIALVCHAPGALRHVKTAEGKPLVEGKNVTGFTNSEEEAVGLTKVVPFLVEDELKAKGGHFSKTGDWGVHVVSDGLLITGQNYRRRSVG
jgi:putative intracellular protease/amidase